MDSLDLEAERRLAELLGSDESPVEIVRTSFDLQGGVGDGYLVVTPRRLVVGDRPISGTVTLRDFPLAAVRRVELHDDGPTRGRLIVHGESGELGQMVYSGFERGRLEALPGLVERLRAEAAAPGARPPADDGSHADPPAPPVPFATAPSAPPARDAEVPMAIVVADRPRGNRSASIAKGLAIRLAKENVRPGEAVRGTIELGWPSSGRVRGVWWEAQGAERTHVTVQKGSGKNSHSVTYRETNGIVEHVRILFGTRKTGFFSLAWEGLKAFFLLPTDNPELAAGEYGYDFEFALPADALPTYQGPNAAVHYEVRARVDIPGGFDLTASVPICVEPLPVAEISGTSGEHRPGQGLSGLFTAEVEMHLDVESGSVRPGDPLPFSVRVKNLGGKRVRGLNVLLNRREHARAKGYSASSSSAEQRMTVPVERLRQDGSPNPLQIATPGRLFHYAGRYSTVSWELRVELDIAWGIDASVTVPLRLEGRW